MKEEVTCKILIELFSVGTRLKKNGLSRCTSLLMGVLFNSSPPPLLCQDVRGCFADQSAKRGTLLMEFCRGFCFFVFSLQDAQHLYFSLLGFIFFFFFAPVSVLWYLKRKRQIFLWILVDFCLTHEIILLFPLYEVPAQHGLLRPR